MRQDLDWLHDEIRNGLRGLVFLSLPNQPALDIMPMTRETWFQIISRQPIAWDPELDKPRIQAAFLSLMGICERWPLPRDLLRELPPRPKPKELPPAPISHEEAQEILEIIRQAKLDLRLRVMPEAGK
jgi:hypothetical protein